MNAAFRRILYSVDRWGPIATSVLTLVFLIIFGWWYSAKVAKLEGQMSARGESELALRMEIQTFQAYVVNLKETMIRAGIPDVPPPMSSNQSVQPNQTKEK